MDCLVSLLCLIKEKISNTINSLCFSRMNQCSPQHLCPSLLLLTAPKIHLGAANTQTGLGMPVQEVTSQSGSKNENWMLMTKINPIRNCNNQLAIISILNKRFQCILHLHCMKKLSQHRQHTLHSAIESQRCYLFCLEIFLQQMKVNLLRMLGRRNIQRELASQNQN